MGETDARGAVVEALGRQRTGCAVLGSAFYAALLERMIDDVESGGPVWSVLGPHASAPFTDAYPLRLLGGIHRRVLAGDAPELARHYPSTNGDGDVEAAWPAVRALVSSGLADVTEALARPPQTNEVGRSASMIGGFLEVARRCPRPLRVFEIGASAGLNLRFDRFRYEQGRAGFGPLGGSPRFVDCWADRVPPFGTPLEVVGRAGCDLDPVDVTTDAGALTLCAYVWPDPPDRLRRLRAAIEVARRLPAPVDRADAADWLAERLTAAAPVGVTTVVFHSVMWQYLPDSTQAAIVASLEAAGAAAAPDAPLAWLRLEPPLPAMTHTELHLTLWSGDGTRVDRHLADAGFHLGPVRWYG